MLERSPSILWTLLAPFVLAACSGASDPAAKPATNQGAAATAGTDTQAAQKAGPDPAKFIERFDANKDGVLELSELPPRMQRWLAKADSNQDGKLGADELRAHADAMKKEHFARLDSDQDGALTESEVGDRRWKRLGSADENKDGKVTPAEIDKALGTGQPGFLGKGAFGPGGRGHGKGGRGGPGGRMFQLDANQDGSLTAEEVGADRWVHLAAADADKDGKVTKDELRAARRSGKLAPMKRKPASDDDDGPDDE